MGNSLLERFPLENFPKSLAINGVLDSEKIADLLKFYISDRLKSDVYILESESIDNGRITESVEYLCGESDQDVSSFKGLPSVFEFFKKIDYYITDNKPIYFIIKLPRIMDNSFSVNDFDWSKLDENERYQFEEQKRYRDKRKREIEKFYREKIMTEMEFNTAIRDADEDCDNKLIPIIEDYVYNEIDKKCWQMFSFVRSLEETKYIRMVFLGNWNSHNVKKLFSDSRDSFPFQGNDIYLQDCLFNSSPESSEYSFLSKKYPICKNKDAIRKIYDYCKGDIISTLFLFETLHQFHANSEDQLDEYIMDIRFQFYNYWKGFFCDNEFIQIKNRINEDTVAVSKKKDTKESYFFYTVKIFKTFTQGQTIIFRPINYFYESIIILLCSGDIDPQNPISFRNLNLFKKALNIENQLKFFLRRYFEYRDSINIGLVPLFTDEKNEIEKLTTAEQIVNNQVEVYNKLFPDNKWQNNLIEVLTFGQLIELFKVICNNIYSIKEETTIDLIDHNNSGIKKLTLEKDFIIFKNKIDENFIIKIINGSKKEYENKIFHSKEISIDDNWKLIYRDDSKFKHIKVDACLDNLERIKALRNALAHNMHITDDDKNQFEDLNRQFYYLFSYKN